MASQYPLIPIQPPPSVLRIFLRRPGIKPVRSFRCRLLGQLLPYNLAKCPAKTYAIVTFKRTDFASRSEWSDTDISRGFQRVPPLCVELVAFASANSAEPSDGFFLWLNDAQMLLFGGLV